MDQQQVIEAITAWAREQAASADFAEAAVAAASPELLADALEAFDSWAEALGAALMELMEDQPKRRSVAAAPVLTEPPATRVVTEAARNPLYLLSDEGHLSRLGLDALAETGASAWQDLPDGPQREAWPAYLHAGDEDDTFFALGSRGIGGTLHGLHFAEWAPDARPSRFIDRVRQDDDAAVVAMFPRRHLRLAARLYAVATDGQVKASDAREYAKRVGNDAIDVIIPREGEAALTMFTAAQDAPIMIAASNGKAIVFDASELRSQGLRAQGVRGIGLDAGASAVSAFAIEDEELVLLTRDGYLKRMRADDFRPQGRGGGGLQSCKLHGDDRVTALLPTTPNDDLLVIASDGQYLRIPVWTIPLQGRAARGEALAVPAPGQRILDARIVPAGAL